MKEIHQENTEIDLTFCKKCGAPLFESGVIIDESYSHLLPGSTVKTSVLLDGVEEVEVRCAKCGAKIEAFSPS